MKSAQSCELPPSRRLALAHLIGDGMGMLCHRTVFHLGRRSVCLNLATCPKIDTSQAQHVPWNAACRGLLIADAREQVAMHGGFRKRGFMDRMERAWITPMQERGCDLSVLFGLHSFHRRFGYVGPPWRCAEPDADISVVGSER